MPTLGFAPQQPQPSQFNFPAPIDNTLNRLKGALASPTGSWNLSALQKSAPMPQITTGPVIGQQDLQKQINQGRAFFEQKNATQNQGLANQAARGGFGTASPAVQSLQQNANSKLMADLMKQENDTRLQAGQLNAQHQLATEQAAQQGYLQNQQNETGQYGANTQAWQAAQQAGLAQNQLAGQLAEGEAGRQQQSAMANLQSGFQLYGQSQDIDAQMQRLQAQLQTTRQEGGDTRALQQQLSQLEDARQRQMQQVGIGAQQTQQATDIQAQMARLQAQIQAQRAEGVDTRGLESQLAQLQIQSQQQLQQQQLGAQQQMQQTGLAGQMSQLQASLGSQASLQQQQIQAQAQQQVKDIDAQMQRLQAQLQAAAQQGADTRQLQGAIAQLDAQKSMIVQGLVNQGAQQRQTVETQGQLALGQLGAQQQQWNQTFNAAAQARLQQQSAQSQMAQQMQQQSVQMPASIWAEAMREQTQRLPFANQTINKTVGNQMIQQYVQAANQRYQAGMYPDYGSFYADMLNGMKFIRQQYGLG